MKTEQITLLANAGADHNLVRAVDRRLALHLAVIDQNFPAVRILVKSKAQLNQIDIDNYTVLHYAAEEMNPDTVRFLLSQDADSDIPRFDG